MWFILRTSFELVHSSINKHVKKCDDHDFYIISIRGHPTFSMIEFWSILDKKKNYNSSHTNDDLNKTWFILSMDNLTIISCVFLHAKCVRSIIRSDEIIQLSPNTNFIKNKSNFKFECLISFVLDWKKVNILDKNFFLFIRHFHILLR